MHYGLFLPHVFVAAVGVDLGLRRRQAGDGHAEGRAGDVVQTGPVAEVDGGRIAAVFAADAQLDVGTGLFAQFGGHFYQLAHAVLVQPGERVGLVNLVIVVVV